MQVPEYTDADLKSMEDWIKTGGGRVTPNTSTGISSEEKARRRAKNKQRRASRRKNR